MEFIKPTRLARYGTLITCGVLLLIGIGTWFIRYPEIVSTQAKLSGSDAPKPLLSRQNARLASLPFKNGDQIRTGDCIAVLESTSDYKQVLKLSDMVDSLFVCLQKEDVTRINKLMSENDLRNLGELQTAYQTLIQSYIPYRDYVQGNYIEKKKALLGNDLKMVEQSANVLKEQAALSQKELSISQTTIDRNKKLLEEKLISEEEYHQLVSQDLGKQMAVPQSKASKIQNNSQSNSIQKELLELNNQVATQQALFQQAVYNLKSQVEDWKKNYLILSPESGILNYTGFYQESQYVEAGKVIGYFMPPQNHVYAEMMIPQGNFGKVQLGQRVILKFNAYPWQEFGTVTGKVKYISSIPVDSAYYLARVELPDVLKSSYNKELPFREGLQAQAEIITKDMRLSERFYYDFIKQIRK